MKTAILLFYTLFIPYIMSAQQLTKNQALSFAQKLYDVEILSEKGKAVLVKKIKENNLAKLGSFSSFYNKKVETELSVSSILNFCSRAFANEHVFRAGLTSEMEDFIRNTVLPEAQQKSLGEDEIETVMNSIVGEYNEGEFEKMAEKVKQFITTQEGYKIENAIPAEDELPDKSYEINTELFLKSIDRNGYTGITFIGKHMFSSPELGTGLIHPARSVIGKTRKRTLRDLLNISLIDNKVYQDVIKENQAKHLPSESLLLMYAAERAYYYENFATRKAEELKILQNLKESGVLLEKNYNALLDSYHPFEIKEKFDYLPYCNNAIVIDLTNYSNPVEGYRQIFIKLNNLLPELH